jgi:hypothetical protein
MCDESENEKGGGRTMLYNSDFKCRSHSFEFSLHCPFSRNLTLEQALVNLVSPTVGLHAMPS